MTDQPTTRPGAVPCFGCGGQGTTEPGSDIPCMVCNGAGVIVDSGPPPTPNPGLVGVRPCGCHFDWIGTGAPDEYRAARVKLWTEQGCTAKAMDFLEAGPLITRDAGCGHDRRATPRQGSPVLDITDLPPGRS